MISRILLVFACGFVVLGCNAEPDKLQGKDKQEMENWLKNGIPASKSPGGGEAKGTTGTPSAVPTDK